MCGKYNFGDALGYLSFRLISWDCCDKISKLLLNHIQIIVPVSYPCTQYRVLVFGEFQQSLKDCVISGWEFLDIIDATGLRVEASGLKSADTHRLQLIQEEHV